MSTDPVPNPEPSIQNQPGRISGIRLVVWLMVSLLLAALLIPTVLGLPRWIEYEIVLTTWWLIRTSVLTWLLHHGKELTDDYQHRGPRNWFKGTNPGSVDGSGCSGVDGEGCLIMPGLIAALFLAWILIELAIPLIWLLVYFVIRGMLRQAIQDVRTCRGHLGYSVIRAFLWSTLYNAPLAFGVWLIHYFSMKGR